MGKARRVSVSAGNYYHTKETDSIYLKSDEQYNVSLPSLNGKIEGKVNQYYIIKEIDSGSYGRVYLVYDEIINKYFACKMISKSRLKRNFRLSRLARRRNITGEEEEQYDPEEHLLQIKKEVAILKNLTKHPNIVLLVEVLNDTREDNIYLVFELCEKGKLMDIQINKKAEPYTEEKARKYFRDVVLGLEYCHFKKIIHRDIKPDNILVTADDNIKISDFGISYIFNEDQEDATISNKNASPLYLPPEACSSDVPYMKGKAMDIWSLGVTLYALVHGYCPFEDADVINLYKKIENDPVVYSPTISEDLKDLLSKLLQKDPEKRITIQEIKRHPWVTEHDTNPMLSTEENCIYEDITDEEIENSIQPGFMFVSKVNIKYIFFYSFLIKTNNILKY
ncbi:kinase-like protein [Piromyces finnis]|uniref:Kinase-like protein n=1 Tax=Piromyces finnis TaxID=1754191 RepID=A0A1Y1V4H8_9FUNG|nr:kinase-like protein [Piromyces finnis]|eukprot:ORX46441.1 kinase-like protein [Piromyces finnis]